MAPLPKMQPPAFEHRDSDAAIEAFLNNWGAPVPTDDDAVAIANAADGTVLGLRRSDSVWVAVAVNLPVMIAAAREFKLSARSVCGPRKRSTARHTKGTSLELR